MDAFLEFRSGRIGGLASPLGRPARLAAIAALAAVLALASGCAVFGGGEEEELTRDDSAFSEGAGDGMGDGSGMEGAEVDEERVTELEPIYFDFDRAVIRDDQLSTMRENTRAVEEHRGWRTVVIEGHTDERGSEEYNLALGERRANAAKQYMVDAGVDAARLDTVSFGESKPAVQGHDESAWKWNRRAEFRIVR